MISRRMPMGATAASGLVTVPETSGYRLFRTLVGIGAVARDGRGRYRPGILSLRLSRDIVPRERWGRVPQGLPDDLASRLETSVRATLALGRAIDDAIDDRETPDSLTCGESSASGSRCVARRFAGNRRAVVSMDRAGRGHRRRRRTGDTDMSTRLGVPILPLPWLDRRDECGTPRRTVLSIESRILERIAP